MSTWLGVDEETGLGNERQVRISPETWSGRDLVRLVVTKSELPQHAAQIFLDADTAMSVGEKLTRLGQEAQLRAAGWLPADPSAESAYEGDWTPPEDRGNFWDFDRAVAEMRRRAKRGAS